MEIANIHRENSSYLLNKLRNFNKIFRKDVTNDNFTSHKKPVFHPLIRRFTFRKTIGGLNNNYVSRNCDNNNDPPNFTFKNNFVDDDDDELFLWYG